MAERISFTRPSAERIARAVRVVENTRLDGQALSFRRQVLESAKVIKLAFFEGPWPRDSVNTIMFKGTDRTADAANLFFPVPGTQTRECAVAKIGTAWHLIDVPFYERTAVFASGTASRTFFGTGSTSTIRFFGTGSTSTIRFIGTGSTSQISFISSVSTTSGAISFLKGVSASLNTANCTITVTPDQGTATFVASISPTTGTAISVSMGGTQTAMSVSMSGTQTAISVSMSGTQTFTMITNTFTASFLSLEVP